MLWRESNDRSIQILYSGTHVVVLIPHCEKTPLHTNVLHWKPYSTTSVMSCVETSSLLSLWRRVFQQVQEDLVYLSWAIGEFYQHIKEHVICQFITNIQTHVVFHFFFLLVICLHSCFTFRQRDQSQCQLLFHPVRSHTARIIFFLSVQVIWI